MKKVLQVVCFAVGLLCCSAQIFAEPGVNIHLRLGEDTIQIHGETKKIERPELIEGTTMVPLRVIVEGFGANVGWEEATKTITITEKQNKMVLQIGSKEVIVDENKKQLLVAPKLINGTTMVPLRFISENFGAKVLYNEVTREIQVEREIRVEQQEKFKFNWISAYRAEYNINTKCKKVEFNNRTAYIINSAPIQFHVVDWSTVLSPKQVSGYSKIYFNNIYFTNDKKTANLVWANCFTQVGVNQLTQLEYVDFYKKTVFFKDIIQPPVKVKDEFIAGFSDIRWESSRLFKFGNEMKEYEAFYAGDFWNYTVADDKLYGLMVYPKEAKDFKIPVSISCFEGNKPKDLFSITVSNDNSATYFGTLFKEQGQTYTDFVVGIQRDGIYIVRIQADGKVSLLEQIENKDRDFLSGLKVEGKKILAMYEHKRVEVLEQVGDKFKNYGSISISECIPHVLNYEDKKVILSLEDFAWVDSNEEESQKGIKGYIAVVADKGGVHLFEVKSDINANK